MRAARIFLGLGAVVLACYAVPFLLSPGLLGTLVELEYKGPNAYVEIRSFYGGLELGMAAFFLWAARRPPMVSTALAAFACFFGCAGLARAWGIAEYGFSDPSHPIVAGVEVVGAGVAVWLRGRLGR